MITSNLHADVATTKPVYPGSRIITDGMLVVELTDPDAANKYYTGIRFSPVAAVIRASLEGKEYLYHAEKHDPKTDVAGLFSEFDLVTSPIGFDGSAIGQSFLKIGVGSLVKTTEKYEFYTQYPVSHLATTRATWKDNSATFNQSFNDGGDYAYEMHTVAVVKDHQLQITWNLTNTGKTEMKTQHYSHNSFRFDNQNPGPDYLLSFPFDFVASGMRSDVIQTGQAISFTKFLEKPINIAISCPAGYSGANELTLTNRQTNQKIVVSTSIPGTRIALHMAPQYICPEQFVEIVIKPGESKTWQRNYSFGNTAAE